MNFGRTFFMDEKMHHSWPLHPKTTHTQIKVFGSPLQSIKVQSITKTHSLGIEFK